MQVAVRLREGSASQLGHLPTARAATYIDGNALVVVADESRTRHEFNCCQEGGEEAVLLAKAEVPKLLRSLLSGVSVGILGVGVEGEKAGSFARLLTSTLDSLRELVEQQRDQTNVILSYGIYGISDSSCIDLLNYERRETDQIATLMDTWTALTDVTDVGGIIAAVEQGYSLPCVVVVRVFAKSQDAELPGAMSTLLLADLGSLSAGTLEKSLAQLKSLIFTMDQPIMALESAAHGAPPSYLSAFIERCFGGDMLTLVVAEVPKTGNARMVNGALQLLDAMRRIKNHPTPRLESPELLELETLVQAHTRLEVEHRSVRRELKQLQRALKVTEMQKDALLSESSESSMSSETQRWELQLEMARINMEKLQVHERIRQCEIDLVCMEHERLLLLAEMSNKQRQLAALEERLRGSLEEKEKIKQEFSAEICGLSSRLEEAQRRLSAAEREKSELQSNLESATARIVSLGTHIAEKEQAKREIEAQLKKDSAFTAMQLDAKLAELSRLQSELARARECEATLNRRLTVLESSSDTYKTAVSEAETKLAALKVENATLLAKLEVLSKKPQSPEVTRTIRIMEDKWEQERRAMHSVMDDLRRLIEAKDAARILLSPPTTAALSEPAAKRGRPSAALTSDRSNDAASTALPRGKKKVTIREEDPSSESDAEDSPRADQVKASSRHRGRRGEAIKSLSLPTDRETPTRGPEKGVKSLLTSVLPSATANAASRGKKKAPITTTTITTNTGVPLPQTQPATIPKEKTIKLQHPRTKENKPQPASPAALSKLFGPEINQSVSTSNISTVKTPIASVESAKEVEIPGTPPKKTLGPGGASPGKVWKPSAFIPGVAKKPVEANPASTGSIFASLSFAAGNSTDDGIRKRVKLPDRPKPLAAPNNPAADRRQDSAALSAIMSSFNIPSKK